MAFKFTMPSESTPTAKPFIGPARKPATPSKGGNFKFSMPSESQTTKPSNYGQVVTKKLKYGGEYNSVVGEPNKIVETKRSQSALETNPYSERDHTVPHSLGGTSTKDNLKAQPYSLIGKLKVAVNKVTKSSLFDKPEQPSYKTEMAALKDYEAGKISLPEARLRVLKFKDEQELKQKGITQSNWNNFFGEVTKMGRDLVSAAGKVFAEGATSLVRVAQTAKSGFKQDYLSKPAEVKVESPLLKKILTYGDTTKDPTQPLTIKIDPLFTGKEKFGEFTRKIAGAGAEVAGNIIAPGEFTSLKTLKVIGKTPISALSKDTLVSFAKQLAVEKAIPGFAIGTMFGGGAAVKEGKSAKDVLKEALTTGAIVSVFELALVPFKMRGALKKEASQIINKADPNISYIERPDLGKDVNGKPVLTRSEIDPRTGKAVVEFRQDLKKQPALFLRSLEKEHGTILEAKAGNIKNEGRVLDNVLEDFSQKTGEPKEVISKKIALEVKKNGGNLEAALERAKQNPAEFKKAAPTLSALTEHRIDPVVVRTKTSTDDLVNDLVDEIKAKSPKPKVEKTELNSPLHQEARKYKSADEFVNKSESYKYTYYHATPSKSAIEKTGFKDDTYAWPTKKQAMDYAKGQGADWDVVEVKSKQRLQADTPGIPDSYKMDNPDLWLLGKDNIKTKSQLTDIYNQATAKKPRTADDYNKKLPDKLKMKHPKEAEQLESHAKKSNPKELESKVYERLKEELPENMRDELTYSRMNLKEDAEKAVKMIAKDRNQALRIATGLEEPPKGQTGTAVNIALAEKALQEGNYGLAGDLIKSRSLAQTRRGQEIVAEKGSITDNSTDRYIRELISSRLSKLGKGYLDNSREYLASKIKKGGMSRNQRAMERIKSEAKTAAKDIRATKSFDLAQAQKLIDSLSC